jgi:hypothetical protein
MGQQRIFYRQSPATPNPATGQIWAVLLLVRHGDGGWRYVTLPTLIAIWAGWIVGVAMCFWAVYTAKSDKASQ